MTRFAFLFIWAFLAVELFGTSAAFAGTVDAGGGGGNGIRNRMYESYIRDPMRIPAYKLVEPILKRYDAVVDANSTNVKDAKPTHMEDLFHTKLYYFAPVRWKSVAKAKLGLSMMEDPTQQIARQNEEEVWVRSDIFDGMTLADQSDVLLHEFVMTWYLLKFKTFSEMCALSAKVDEADACKADQTIDAMYPPVRAAGHLNKDDYRSIRSMTDWLKANGTTATFDQFQNAMWARNFDRRFLNNASTNNENLKLTSDDVVTAIERARIVGNSPSRCEGDDGKQQPCEFRASFAPSGYDKLPVINVRLSGARGEVLPADSLAASTEYTLFAMGKDAAGQVIYGLLNFSTELKHPQLGDRTNRMVLLFRKTELNGTTLAEFVGVMITPMKITGVFRDRSSCRAEAFRTTRPDELRTLALTPNAAFTTPLKYNLRMIGFDFYCPAAPSTDVGR